jgi:hypothetical protein
MKTSMNAVFALFSATFAKLQNPEIAENAAQELLSPRLDKAWKALNLVRLDQDNIEKCLTGGLYAEAADALKTAVNEAQKKEKVMAKKGKKTATGATAKKTPVKKGEKKVDAEAAKTPVKKATVKKSRYGHREGSSAAYMDDQLQAGCIPDTVAEALVKDFGVATVEKAKAKLLVHVRYLKKERDVVFYKKTDGTVKAKTAKIVWPKAA